MALQIDLIFIFFLLTELYDNAKKVNKKTMWLANTYIWNSFMKASVTMDLYNDGSCSVAIKTGINLHDFQAWYGYNVLKSLKYSFNHLPLEQKPIVKLTWQQKLN